MSNRVLRVTVCGGLAGVNRVVGLVRVRGTGPRSITAWVTAETDTWVVEHTLIANEERAALLQRQLERLPCVVAVQHGLADPAVSPDALEQGTRGMSRQGGDLLVRQEA